jgi:hypothetical protein
MFIEREHPKHHPSSVRSGMEMLTAYTLLGML